MKVSNIALLSLSAAFVIIGTHQTITQGIVASYPIFMLAVVLLFWYKYRQNQRSGKDDDQDNSDLKGKRK
ncbi:hypothetical protein [Cecembia rubra]|uniref:Uncharacterized protein n=1 Tax=Cecembia rubra TaxID=1485585 RepID=A0A2P8E4Q9_9BACT|nr:hypothetical protein [Cecembia rubra]PSL04449.1 hypothetical protein CLV48_105193 [Cecembia rubra]